MTPPLTVICWRWRPSPGYRSKFGPETVRILRNMVKRHYPHPHRFVCVTDHPSEIDKGIETIPLWKEWGDIPSPHGGHNPSCYRRLRMFSPDAEALFGKRFVSLDLDTVIVGDLSSLWNRPEDFVMWGETDPRSYYNGSMLLMTAGARPQVWERFNPKTSPQEAKAAGRFGSDQGFISHVLGPGEATWRERDGVLSYRLHLGSGSRPLPPHAKVVMFHGGTDPDSPRAQRHQWVRKAYQ